jgi:hypothetical protein
MTAALSEIIARVEAATEGSRELDWMIAEALNEVPPHTIRSVGLDYDWWRKPGDFALWMATDSEGRSIKLWQPERRTSSLDAALTLVYGDGGGLLLHLSDIGADGLPIATVTRRTDRVDEHSGIARTLALSVCAAALRARLATQEQKL